MPLTREMIDAARTAAAHEGLIDRAVRAVNPRAANDRMRDRFQGELARQVMNSGYSESGASSNKPWSKGGGLSSRSPHEDINRNLPTLRRNARSLFMNDPVARAMITRIVDFAIGTGLRLRLNPDADALGITPDEAAAWARRMERRWYAWADSKACDVQGINTFDEIQELSLIAWLQSGDVFVLLPYHVPGRAEISGLRLQVIEADRVINPSDYTSGTIYPGMQKLKSGNLCVDGVEIDPSGRVVAYHVAKEHPLALNHVTAGGVVRVELRGSRTGRRQVLHCLAAERPEQWRGVPMLAPVIETLAQRARYREAELDAAIINSYLAVLVESDYPEAPIGAAYPSTDQAVGSDEADAPYRYELGPATMLSMRRGDKVHTPAAAHPSGTYQSFNAATATEAGAGVGLPYEFMIGKFDASFSASRGAVQLAWQGAILRNRRRIVQNLCMPTVEEFITEQLLLGVESAPGFFDDPVRRAAWLRAVWHGPSVPVLNPVDEAKAAKIRVDERLSTRTKEAAAMGNDWFQEVLPESEIEQREMTARDILPPVNTNTAPTGAGGDKDAE